MMIDPEDNERELAALFAAEDQTFESEAFTGIIMRPIRRRAGIRRAVISIAALIGGMITGSQLPKLYNMLNLPTATGDPIATVQSSLAAGAADLSPLWLIGAVCIVCSAAMTFLIERT